MENANTNLTNTNETTWLWPAPYSNKHCSRGYYEDIGNGEHLGIDLKNSTGGIYGTPVVAAKSGTVVKTYKGCYNHNALGDWTDSSTWVDCSRARSADGSRIINLEGCDYADVKNYGTVDACNFTYGNGVIIAHECVESGQNVIKYSQYIHLSELADGIEVDTPVERGQIIGYVGSTGESSGPHLHFSLSNNTASDGRYNNNPKNKDSDGNHIVSIGSYHSNACPGTCDSNTCTRDYDYEGGQYYDFNISLIQSPYKLNGGLWATPTFDDELEEARYNLIRSRCSEDYIRDKNFLVRVGGTAKIRSDVPVRDGYEFAGWLCKVNGVTNGTYGAGASISGLETNTNVILTAQWTLNKHKVTLDPRGGTVTPAFVEVSPDGTYGQYTSLPNATRTGYTFNGWYYNGAKCENNTKVKVNEAHSLTAQWTPNEYIVTYVIDNGLPEGANVIMSETSRKVRYDSSINKVYDSTTDTEQTVNLTAPDSKGKYNFKGWYLNPTCTGNKVTDSTMITVNDIPALADGGVNNITLYAKWVCEVKYLLETDSGAAYDAEEVAVGTSKRVISTIPEKTGYHFKGWRNSVTGKAAYPGSEIVISSNTTLTAIWEEKRVVISFDTGGAMDMPDAVVKYSETVNGRIPAPDTIYSSAMRCDGWRIKGMDPDTLYIGEDGDLLPGFESYELIAVDPIKMYYNVTYSYDITGGAGDGDNPELALIERKIKGEPYYIQTVIPSQPYGYNFVCWQDEAGNQYAPGDRVDADGPLNLTAQWLGGCFIVQFNGGVDRSSESPVSSTPIAMAYPVLRNEYGEIVADEGIRLPTEVPVRFGYRFTGWISPVDSPLEVYAPGDLYTMPEAMYENFDMTQTNILTLVALWEPSYVTVNLYDPYNGNNALMSYTARVGDRFGTGYVNGESLGVSFPHIVDRGVIVHVGWSLEGARVTEDSIVESDEELHLYPIFTEIPEYDDISHLTDETVKALGWCKYKEYLEGSEVIKDGQTRVLFAPDSALTRAQLAVIAYSLAGRVSVGSNDYYNVAPGAWYYDAVSWCDKAGVMTGNNGYFDLDGTVSREMYATVLYRLEKMLYCGDVRPEKCRGCSLYHGHDCTLAAFDDCREVSDYARAGMSWAVENGIVRGTSQSLLSPGDAVSRGAAAVILYRYGK